MFHRFDFRQHLLQWNGDLVFDLDAAGARESHEDIGEGDVDLRLFLARRHDDGEQAQHQGRKRQQRRQFVILELTRDTSRKSQSFFHGCCTAGRLA